MAARPFHVAAWCLSLSACTAGSGTPATERQPIRVFAAASLTEILQELAGSYDGAPVSSSLGGSGSLARQIRDGAPADLFLSASPEWIEFLRGADLLADEPVVIARNSLVCVTAGSSPAAPRQVRDARSLLEAIGHDGLVAIADEGVPAGEYARAALGQLRLLEAFRPHLAGQRDVRAVLHAVERGEVPAGFVYSTDAKIAEVETLFTFDPTTHPPITYQAAVVRGGREAGARRFLDHLRSGTARSLLLSAGFALP